MKIASGLVVAAVLAGGAVQGLAQDKPALQDERQKISYSLGVDIANNLKRQGIEVDGALVAQGLKDALAGGKLLLTDTEMKEAMGALQRELMAKRQERAKAQGEKAKAEGEAFLAENKKKEGIVVLPSGLQYKVSTEGSGAQPKATDTVSVNYRGTLVDGTEFDSSYKRGQAATFPVNGVISGWTEALQLMKVGAKWQLFIPSTLAYGERGASGSIPPNATLIFEVELLEIK
ncbi:MAG: FKBP-type peptidyl-prolyl cis-trans isomerase [Acidobacteriota bacterium]